MVDLSQEYYEMCSASAQIQSAMKLDDGTWFAAVWQSGPKFLCGYTNYASVDAIIRQHQEEMRINQLPKDACLRTVMMPRQDQLQKLCYCKGHPAPGYVATFLDFLESKERILGESPSSFEQAWLEYYMMEVHSKYWDKTNKAWLKADLNKWLGKENEKLT